MSVDLARVPDATYRLQLQPEFGFDAAAGVVGYLSSLGVSHTYTAPYVQSAAGSVHGYDGVDPTRVDDELGGPEAHARFVAAVLGAGLGQVVDIVPNHLGIADARNLWWTDVLRHGRNSEFATYFDIDWEVDDPALRGKVMLPVLGAPLTEELARGVLRVEADGDDGWVRYHDVRFPLAAGSLDGLDGPATPEAVGELLGRQHYVLTHWREGLTELNYRRFFDVTTLAGVRVEDPDVFDAVHALVLGWVASGEVDGVRVDHVDGLADPAAYVEQLAARADGAWLVIEKILVGDEQLDESWPVAGTTGYDALAELTDVLVDPNGRPAIDAVYERLTDSGEGFADVLRRSKQQVVGELLQPEVRRCARELRTLAAATGVEMDLEHAAAVIEAFVVEMPVYRTYSAPHRPASVADRALVIDTVARTLARHPEAMARGLAVLADAFLHPSTDGDALIRHVQQLTGPAMAKGCEDTAFYRDSRFVVLNEVGGDGPTHFGASVATFHDRCEQRARQWPHTMVTTSTHDTKRSEDVRARLAVLSEVPIEWAATLERWCARSAAWWSPGFADPALDMLIHQTLLGAHPLPADRAHEYLDKAMREAKVHTSWLAPDAGFEAAAHAVLDRALADPEHVAEVGALAHQLLLPGRVNALSQKLLALTMPGIPDVYQGSELWDLSLVDPDNRRAVDYVKRAELLATIPAVSTFGDAKRWSASLSDPDDPGIAKLALVHHALRVRHERRSCFVGADASYEPLIADGPASDHVVAFVRGGAVATVVPRLTVSCARRGRWRDTAITLPDGEWHDVFTGAKVSGSVQIASLLATFPVALLVMQ